MTKNIKTTIITVLATFATLFVALGCIFSLNVFVSADSYLSTSLVMCDGAWIRMEKDSSGLKFVAQINDYDENKEYGMFIAPKGLIDSLETTDYINEINRRYPDKELAICGKTYEDNGKYFVTGAIANLKYRNMNAVWFGIAFEKSFAEGKAVYKYASVSEIGVNERSITSVATGALNSDTEFTEEQLSILKNFVNRAANEKNGVAETDMDKPANIAVSIAEGNEKTVKVGDRFELGATIIPAIDSNIKYSSSNASVAAVNENGSVTVNSSGSAAITAEIAGVATGTINVKAYDYTISDASELAEYLNELNNDAYKKHTAALVADIDCKGVTVACGISFAGILDGMGHTIYNLSIGNRLFEMIKGATIKNIGFVNVTRTGGGGGILINDTDGNAYSYVQNVFVQGVHNGVSSLIGGLAGSGAGTLYIDNSVFLIEFANPVSGQGALVAYGDIESSSRNYHLVSTTSSGIMLDNGSTEGLYKSENEFKNVSATLIENFDNNLWTISDGMLCFKSAADKIIKTYKESTVIAAANREEKGFEIDLTKYNLDTISVTADGKDFTEYTYENGVLRVAGGKLANGKKTITVTSKNKAISFYAEVADYAVGTAEEFNAWGAYVQTNGFTGKRMILTSDVDYAGNDFNVACGGDALSRNISSCEIDGRGYTINNFGSSSGMFYSVTEVTLKNIGFANIDVHSNWGFFGRVISKMNIENVYVQGNLDLLFTHSNGGNYASDGVGVFGYYGDAETQGKNLLLKVEMSGGKYDEGEAFRYAVCGYGLQNVTNTYSLSASSNGKCATWLDNPTSGKIYTDATEYMAEIGEIYKAFNSKYWVLENNELKLVHVD